MSKHPTSGPPPQDAIAEIAPELSRPVDVTRLSASGTMVHLNPSADELAAIAKRLDLISVDHLNGKIRVRPTMGREITAEGMVSAQVQQTCVVTGDALPTTLEFPLLRRYSEDADALAGLDVDEDEIVDPDHDDPDPIENGTIDVGEAAVEELALQLPPYPRKLDAAFDEVVSSPPGTVDEPENPFAKLEQLKKSLKSDD
jgi:uncharacterized metal-binding protein YceD (DUF177 family)